MNVSKLILYVFIVLMLICLSSCPWDKTLTYINVHRNDNQKMYPPSFLSIKNPPSSQLIQVTGVSSGDLITVFSDGNCATSIATGLATASSIDIDVTGAACSGNPISQAENQPWVNVAHSGAPGRAKELCESLGSGFHLVTNDEWMTIARNIETNTEYQSYNWSGGSVGNGYIHNGHNDSTPNTTLAASNNDLEKCYGTVTAGVNPNCVDAGAQQRTHTLSNGEVVWDLAGNIWEWIDWEISEAFLKNDKAIPPHGLVNNWGNFYVNPNFTIPTTSMPSTSFEPKDNTLTSANGIGEYYPATAGSGGSPQRSGAYYAGQNSGIYTLLLLYWSSHSLSNFSFRCAYSE